MSRRGLPYVDPQKRRGAVYRAYARLVGTRAMGWLSRKVAWKLDPFLHRLSGGRIGTGLLLPTALLETRGARTGQPRRNVVIYFHDGERVTIIASKLGLPQHPAWLHNLRAHPDVKFGGQPFTRRSSTTSRSGRGSGNWRIASSRTMPSIASGPLARDVPSRSSS